MPGMRVSQKDIAKLANVSQGTVSAVLNDQKSGNTKVSDATRKRIMEIVEKYNYRPNMQARQLRGGTSNLVGVLVNEGISLLLYNILRSLEMVFQKRGYALVISVLSEDIKANRDTLLDFSNFNLNALLCLFHTHAGAQDMFLDYHSLFRKILFLDPGDFLPGTSGVDIRYAEGIEQAVLHLHAQGKRKIALLQSDLEFAAMKERYRGYRDGLKQLGLEFEQKRVCIYPDYELYVQKMPELIGRLLQEGDADAIIAGNEQWAIAAMKELRRRGIQVPGEVAVICFADYPELCTAATPELSAVQYDLEGIAQAFMTLLDDPATEDFSAAKRIAVDGILFPRESTLVGGKG